MSIELSNRWKEFAFGELVYNWSPKKKEEGEEQEELKTAAAMFDILVEAQKAGEVALIEAFQNYDIMIWGPFECMEFYDIVDYMINMASKAQTVSNGEAVTIIKPKWKQCAVEHMIGKFTAKITKPQLFDRLCTLDTPTATEATLGVVWFSLYDEMTLKRKVNMLYAMATIMQQYDELPDDLGLPVEEQKND